MGTPARNSQAVKKGNHFTTEIKSFFQAVKMDPQTLTD